MFEYIYLHFLMLLHFIAPYAIAIDVGVLVWLWYMSRKWKLDDPKNWKQK